MPPSTKAQIRDALTNIHEREITYPLWGLTLLLREYTARERRYANDAVLAEAPDDPDQILYQAMLMQRCIVDPESGRPYMDGRAGPDGQPAIDPRTRAPLFTVADIQEIADGRAGLFTQIWDDLISLAGLGPRALFRGSDATDGSERDAGAGAAPAGDATESDASQGSSDPDRGDASAHQPEQDDGDTNGGTA